MPEFVLPEPSEPFQSAQIYGWIEQLCVRSYADLLAPHWNVHDRSVPTERFDPARFTRSRRTAARAVPVVFRDSQPLLERQTPARPPMAVVIVDRSRESGTPEPTPGESIQATPIGRLLKALARWWRGFVTWCAGPRR
jgi:hypothetical protein